MKPVNWIQEEEACRIATVWKALYRLVAYDVEQARQYSSYVRDEVRFKLDPAPVPAAPPTDPPPKRFTFTRHKTFTQDYLATVTFECLKDSILLTTDPGGKQDIITVEWDQTACRCDLLLNESRREDGRGYALWQISQRVLRGLILKSPADFAT